ncbi:MAG: recombination mediator RecR [Desulfatiglandaceae bacterium]
MGIYPPPLERLITQLVRLPGIGQKSATRLALHILRSDRSLADAIARCLVEVKDQIRICSVCCNLTDTDPCAICRNEARADGSLCVVEGPGDLLAIEESGVFKGKYHVLHGVLAPLDGIGPEDIKIPELLERLDREVFHEVILATNPTAEGEATAAFLAKRLIEKAPDLKVMRIALGVPLGGDLKYMDRMTIDHAMKRRIPA